MDQEVRNSWQQAQYAWLSADLLQALKGEPLNGGFSADGTLFQRYGLSSLLSLFMGSTEEQVERNLEDLLLVIILCSSYLTVFKMFLSCFQGLEDIKLDPKYPPPPRHLLLVRELTCQFSLNLSYASENEIGVSQYFCL